MKFAIGRKSKSIEKSMDIIHDYLYDEHGNAKDREFYFTIFPRSEINDYALSKRVER